MNLSKNSCENLYILEDKKPIIADNNVEWGQYLKLEDNIRVAKTAVADGILEVSTIFVGYDLSYGNHDIPVVFETLVFHKVNSLGEWMQHYSPDVWCRRYATWEEAEIGHNQTVDELNAEIILNPIQIHDTKKVQTVEE